MLGNEPKKRVTQANPAFMDSVAACLKQYRDGGNPGKENITDTELARRLGVSKSALSKYMNRKQVIGGEPFARMVALGINITLGDKKITAQEHAAYGSDQSTAEQICFVFDTPCFVDETSERVGVTLAASAGGRLVIHLKLAG